MTSLTSSDLEGKEFLSLVQAVHRQLLELIDYREVDKWQENREELKLYLRKETEKLIEKGYAHLKENERSKLIRAVIDEVLGFGPIEPLFLDPAITDIFVNDANTVFIEKNGKVEKTDIRFIDNDHVLRLVQRVASKSGRHLDLGSPYFDAQLADGSRIHAIIPPIALDGIKVSIRKHMLRSLPIDDLVNKGSLTAPMAKLLHLAVQARFNIAICGGTGSGKTTLLNSLLSSIRQGERIITIEDTPELEPSFHHVVQLLTRLPNQEGKGGVTQADLMINALRMRPDRVILGELRGAEAFNLLHAMNTGQDGSMVTLHASGTEEVVSRILNMILMARYTLSVESVIHQIAGALDLIVYVSRLVDGSRRVMTIAQVSAEENGKIKIEDLFRFDIEKISTEELRGQFVQNRIEPTKRILNKLIVSGLIQEYRDIT
jgi:pilus assembly protein CpaF